VTPLLLLVACQDYILTTDDKGPADTAADDTHDTDRPSDTSTSAHDSADTADTDDTGTPAPRTACDSILVFSTEAGTASRGLFDGLESEPALASWDVDVYERAAVGDLTDTMLTNRSQLWLFGTDAGFGTTLSLAEVVAIRDFVNGGGGLLVAAGETDDTTSYSDDVSLIAEPYGVKFDGTYREGADGTVGRVAGADPVLFAGVTELPVFASVAELERTDPAVETAGNLGGGTSIAKRDDGVRVVFDRSWRGWSDAYRTVGEQGVFVLNVATFLEPCE
jgi:hypothetical protein